MLKGDMDRRGTRFRGLLALVATLFAVFVLVPIADAATCGSESGPVAEASAHADGCLTADSHDDLRDDAGGDHSTPAVHGTCAHGHCHHASTGLPPHGEGDGLTSSGASTLPVSTQADLASLTPEALERPPRT